MASYSRVCTTVAMKIMYLFVRSAALHIHTCIQSNGCYALPYFSLCVCVCFNAYRLLYYCCWCCCCIAFLLYMFHLPVMYFSPWWYSWCVLLLISHMISFNSLFLSLFLQLCISFFFPQVCCFVRIDCYYSGSKPIQVHFKFKCTLTACFTARFTNSLRILNCVFI